MKNYYKIELEDLNGVVEAEEILEAILTFQTYYGLTSEQINKASVTFLGRSFLNQTTKKLNH